MKQSQTPMPPNEQKVSALKTVFYNTCVFFTFFAVVTLTTAQLFGIDGLILPLSFFLLLPFALCISLANLIFKAKSINTFLKLLIHFSAITAAFYLCFCTSGKKVNVFVLVLVFAVIYAVIATPILIIFKYRKKKKEPKNEYVSMFKDVSGSKK